MFGINLTGLIAGGDTMKSNCNNYEENKRRGILESLYQFIEKLSDKNLERLLFFARGLLKSSQNE